MRGVTFRGGCNAPNAQKSSTGRRKCLNSESRQRMLEIGSSLAAARALSHNFAAIIGPNPSNVTTLSLSALNYVCLNTRHCYVRLALLRR
jgi:hypothetical protein